VKLSLAKTNLYSYIFSGNIDLKDHLTKAAINNHISKKAAVKKLTKAIPTIAISHFSALGFFE